MNIHEARELLTITNTRYAAKRQAEAWSDLVKALCNLGTAVVIVIAMWDEPTRIIALWLALMIIPVVFKRLARSVVLARHGEADLVKETEAIVTILNHERDRKNS